MKNKWIALLLAAVLTVCMLPLPVSRAEDSFTISLTRGNGMYCYMGEMNQTVQAGKAISTIVFFAQHSYYFPEDYEWSMSGLKATRISATQINITGTPTESITATVTAASQQIRVTGITISPNPDVLMPGDVLTAVSPKPDGATVSYMWLYDDDTHTVLGKSQSYTIREEDVGKGIKLYAEGVGFYYNIVTARTKATVTRPVISFDLHPTGGQATGELKASASVSTNGAVTLEWFACDAGGTITGPALQTGDTFLIPTDLAPGVHYFLCQATAPGALAVRSDVTAIVVDAPPATGDHSHPATYLLLLLTSFAGMVALRQKRARG